MSERGYFLHSSKQTPASHPIGQPLISTCDISLTMDKTEEGRYRHMKSLFILPNLINFAGPNML